MPHAIRYSPLPIRPLSVPAFPQAHQSRPERLRLFGKQAASDARRRAGMLALSRRNQRQEPRAPGRERPETDGEFCLSPQETGVVIRARQQDLALPEEPPAKGAPPAAPKPAPISKPCRSAHSRNGNSQSGQPAEPA